MKRMTTQWMAGALALGMVMLRLGAGTAHAASIAYVGHQEDVELAVNDPTRGWRNPEPAKPLDIDGDNILGTDGYGLNVNGNYSIVGSRPSYVSSWSVFAVGGSNTNAAWGVMDDPADPTGPDTRPFGCWFKWPSGPADIFTFTTTGDLVGQTLRLGLLYDTRNYASGTIVYTVRQTVGGSATASSPSLAVTNPTTGMDVAFFDLAEVAAGDTFVVHVDGAGSALRHLGGVVFDTASAPPAGTVIYIR